MIRRTEDGLFCPEGGFHVDPWRPVDVAVITHAHADHARPASGRYVCAEACEPILRLRLGKDIDVETLPYGEERSFGPVTLSLHPAGHILGSAQVRVERGGEVWVVTGDFKRHPDPTCAAFEQLACNTLVTECTFGVPVYRWPDEQAVLDDVNAWWRSNVERKRTSVLYAYALGKAQRILSGLDPSIGPILCHGAIDRLNTTYRAAGVDLPDSPHANDDNAKETRGQAIVLAPPSASGTRWLRQFGTVSSAFASGWMQIRGQRRRRSVDRGFVLSDHADWDDLNAVIDDSGASRVGLTHGSTRVMSRWLTERGVDNWSIETEFEGEADEPTEETEP